ncbi:unnamed protein product [Psylliodes chrysocephalus]|uniref:Uncharacterized protein n=1 Tax=Psylliodes chrysocephalus TaxID=3402493 RepID=A0A9P0CLD2_9CUCU|nr:unnamed protein product [Psylliodes chrysocephala]
MSSSPMPKKKRWPLGSFLISWWKVHHFATCKFGFCPSTRLSTTSFSSKSACASPRIQREALVSLGSSSILTTASVAPSHVFKVSTLVFSHSNVRSSLQVTLIISPECDQDLNVDGLVLMQEADKIGLSSSLISVFLTRISLSVVILP